MRVLSTARSSALFSLLIVGSLSAQSMAPPPYLQIFREEVKMGRGAPHELTESGWPRAFAAAKIRNNYVAMTTLYGPAEAWFFEGRASLAEIEAINKAIEAAPGLSAQLGRLSQADAANVASVRSILARYLPEASNGPDINPAEMRVWELAIVRVRPGKEANFVEGAKLYKSMAQQAKVEAPWATYAVMAGLPGPTYFILSPRKSLAELDPATGVIAAIDRVITEETGKKFGTLAEGFISWETMIFAPSPAMSHLTPEWIAQDPKYWGKKATPPRPTP